MTGPTPFDALLDFERRGEAGYVVTPAGTGFLYGGLSLAALLRVGLDTVPEDMAPRSLHAFFLRGGHWGEPLAVRVDRLSDSRSFASRHLRLGHGDDVSVEAVASFHVPVTGPGPEPETRTTPAPDVPDPDELAGFTPQFGSELDLGEVRTVAGVGRDSGGIIHPYWARYHQISDSPAALACGLAFLSDYLVIGSPFAADSGAGNHLVARTLEHALWFHRPVTSDDWHLFDCSPLAVEGGRYVSRGTVHDRGGRLVASFTQEGVIRAPR